MGNTAHTRSGAAMLNANARPSTSTSTSASSRGPDGVPARVRRASIDLVTAAGISCEIVPIPVFPTMASDTPTGKALAMLAQVGLYDNGDEFEEIDEDWSLDTWLYEVRVEISALPRQRITFKVPCASCCVIVCDVCM